MLLDCTLRDGGFVNDWEFGYSSIRSIVSRLDKAGIDVIEIGFLDVRRNYDPNRSIFPDTSSISDTLAGLTVEHAELVGMVDYGSCPIENIAPREESLLDGIRVIFKKRDIQAALAYCGEIQAKGYKVFANPVSLTSYADREILQLIDDINSIKPSAVSIVDTYGLMLREEILHYIDLVDRNLDSSILLGYHSHNNQQMAFANCTSFLDRRTKRGLIVDSSLYGMGKSAGNANTELVAAYVNRAFGGAYRIDQLLDCIHTDILRIHRDHPWGYNLHFYISAVNDCHPDYVKFLLDKGTLSTKGMEEILASIPRETKLSYSRPLIEKLYFDYQSVAVDDSNAIAALAKELANRDILLALPGHSLRDFRADIQEIISAKDPIVIAVNFLDSDFPADFVFVGNGQRYDRLLDSYHGHTSPPRVIATSNVLEANVPIEFTLNYEGLLDVERESPDSSAVLCLNSLRKIGIKEIFIAGLDGFSEYGGNDFFDPSMDMAPTLSSSRALNAGMTAYLDAAKDELKLHFVTPSIFDNG